MPNNPLQICSPAAEMGKTGTPQPETMGRSGLPGRFGRVSVPTRGHVVNPGCENVAKRVSLG